MASIVLKTGIKCKKIPARFEPIIEIPFIQRIKDANPGKSTTYVNVKTKGNWIFVLKPRDSSIKYAGNKNTKPAEIIVCKRDKCLVVQSLILND